MSAQQTIEQGGEVRTAPPAPTPVAGPAGAVGGRPARLYAAALLTIGAAAVHLAVAPAHLGEYLPYGVFFACLGVAQVGLGIGLIAAPGRRLMKVGAAGTVGVIALWVLSRTTGLPIGPVPWRPDAMGFPDGAATLMEAAALVQLLLRLRRPARRRGPFRAVLKMAPVALLAVGATVAGVGAALSPMETAFNAAPPVAGKATTSMVDLVAPPGPEPVKSFTLTAGVVLVGGRQAWAINGSVPGPELRVTQGDRVRVTLVNRLPASTSLHWHGIRVPAAEDGVAGLTQDAVPSGASFTYEFIASDAGTFWYHSHQNTSEQIPLGLLGALIVEPGPGTVRQERDYSLAIHVLPGSDTIAVNGTPSLHLDARPGETVRLRLINGATPFFDGAPQKLVLLGAPYVIAALDGHDLNQPQELGPERIPLGMGQRADLVFKMPATGSVRLVGIKGIPPLLPFGPPATTAAVTIGEGAPPAAVNQASLPLFDLTRYGVAAPDPVADAGHYDVTQRIALAGGMTFRNGSLAPSDTFNGLASPMVPAIHVREGQLVHLKLVNTSAKSHPIHIHGHVFSVLARNGHPLTGSPVHLDAILVGPGETWDVAFRADNPGIWMLHCHVLAHAAAGMSMSINYEGISTPFTMGSASGNIPE
ncbi:MAG: hypothetical protein NVS9B1_13060 [Candidatus Dormibacteraceae bacterium]